MILKMNTMTIVIMVILRLFLNFDFRAFELTLSDRQVIALITFEPKLH